MTTARIIDREAPPGKAARLPERRPLFCVQFDEFTAVCTDNRWHYNQLWGYITNEKNTYLTVFESLSDPVIMLDSEERIVNSTTRR